MRERDLCAEFGVARHTLRAALRVLAGEGLLRLEPHRGARVARLDVEEVRWLYELRAALEVEAVHLALVRHGGTLPAGVHAALGALRRACAGSDPAWSDVAPAHQRFHAAIVEAAESPRIAAAHAALAGETQLFLLGVGRRLNPTELAEEHAALLARLERDGPAAMREHLHAAAATLARDHRD